MKNAILLIALVLSTGPVPGLAAESKKVADKTPPPAQTQSLQTADENAIRASEAEFVAAFNRGDAKAIAALWTGDCEYVDDTGRIFHGRDAIEKEYAAFFAAHRGLKMETSISSIKIIGAHAAIEEGTAIVKDADGAPVSRAAYTAVHLEEGNKWLMASVREYASPSLSERPNFSDLEWLIGDWTAAKDSKAADFSFKWVADKKFIELSYAVRDGGSVAKSGIQIIGRDPASGDVVSWSFDSTGGYGQGQWTLLKKGLVIESRGMLLDGAATASTSIVSRIDGDSFTWQSVNRRVAGQSLNDAEPVVLKRKTR